MSSRKFAAFDIDGTIARSSLFFQIVDELIAAKHLPPESRSLLDEKYEQYCQRTHADAFNEYTRLSVDVLFENITKLKISDYHDAVDKVIERTRNHVYVYTRDLIAKLRGEGYFLIALSGSEMYAVQEFIKPFGFDVAIGEVYFEKNGYFTGESEEVIHRKDIYLKQLIAEHQLSLEGSIAVGDSNGDKEMLEFVEHPIAFNPEKRLFDIASEKSWKIVVERKNVIYELASRENNYQLTVSK